MSLAKVFLVLTVFTLVIYLGICYLLYKNQKSMMFHPESLSKDHIFTFPFQFEEVTLNPKKDVHLHAIFAKTDLPKKGVVLYHHGNAGSLKNWGMVAPDFLKLGYDVLIPDFRGYGKSTGKLTERALTKDAQLFYAYLKEQYTDKEIVLYGRSMGTGITTNLARTVSCRLVILETPFLSFPAMASEMLPPVLPIKQLLSFKLDNAGNLPSIEAPVYLIHGTVDELVPYQHSKELAAILKRPDVLYTIEGAGHNNISEFPEYHKLIGELLN